MDGFGDIFELLENLFGGFDFDFSSLLNTILALLGSIGGGGGGVGTA